MTGQYSTPTFAELLDWVEGRATAEEAADIAARVDPGNSETAASIRWIEGFLRHGEKNPLPTPPPILRQRLRQLFIAEMGPGPVVPEVRLAEPLFDSRRDTELTGVRGAYDNEGYQLAFSTDEVDILLDVIPQSTPKDCFQLEGQALAASTQAPIWEARVEHLDGEIVDLGGDELGCFSIPDVPRDATRLRLSNGLVEIIVPLQLDPVGG